ncbi:neuronatin isoform X2 [Sturnira hondurensis]|uniref:neuronatin isoform X2 n=1 Tax=Sturnira hondurensis TaxID=192404 RepID=UPI00187A0D79|nr:neuronatin isoform X2 [Sturnira hondurensis]
MRTWVAGGYLRHGHRGCGSAPNSGLQETRGPRRTCSLRHTHSRRPTLATMAAVAVASAELLIIGWYIFRVLLQVFLECCIYWVGFPFRNHPGTQPIARSEVFRYSLQKLAYTVSRTGRQVLGERRRAPN